MNLLVHLCIDNMRMNCGILQHRKRRCREAVAHMLLCSILRHMMLGMKPAR